MARASPIQTSFNAGEWSPRMEGRVDLAKYPAACRRMVGFLPLVQGPAMRRAGFRYLGEVKDSSKRTWLVRYERDSTTGYMLEFGDKYLRFWTNHGQIQATSASIYNGATAYTIGDLVWDGVSAFYYCVANTTGNAPPNATYWYPLTGTVLELPTPYSASDLLTSDGTFALRFAIENDVIYIAHGSYAPRKLSRYSNTKWVLSTPTFSGGPFKAENITTTTLYADAATGAVTVTASAAVFTSGMVGSLLQLSQKDVLSVPAWEAGKAFSIGDVVHSDGKNYKAVNAATSGTNPPTHTKGSVYDGSNVAGTGVQWRYTDSGFGGVRITAYTDSTHVSGTVESPFPSNTAAELPANAVGSGNATTRWALAAWSDVEGWPTNVAFFRERLCFARGTRVWQSVAGDYETFTAKDSSSLVTTDMAISDQLLSNRVNSIQWMEVTTTGVDSLVCGTAGSEFAIKSMTENQPYGTDNHTAVEISRVGSRNTIPVRVNGVLLFVQRAAAKLRDITYNFQNDDYASFDQSVLASHMVQAGITQLAYQHEPHSIIWGVRTDGVLVAMTYSREHYPDGPHGGWHRHPIGGGGVVECIADLPAPDGSRDELWAIAKFTINGSTKRYIAYMEWEHRQNYDPQDDFYVDFGSTYDGSNSANLKPGAGADVDGTTGVSFTSEATPFSSGHVGRQIVYRHSTTDEDGNVTYASAKATITAFLDASHVVCTIESAFPSLSTIAAYGWRLTATTIGSLSFLEGQTVSVLADGAAHPDCVVSGGTITLQYPVSKAQVGMPYRSQLQTQRMNAGGSDGTSQGKKAHINAVTVRLDQTLGLSYGSSFDDLLDVNFRSALDSMDNPPPLFTGDKVLDFPGDFSLTPWLCFEQPQPLPCTIVAVMPQVTTYDKG
jgi:hypothetical protein